MRGELLDGTGGRVARYGAARLVPYASPWTIWLLLPFSGLLFHAFAAVSVSAGVAVGAVVGTSTVGLAAFTWHVFGPRGASIRAHATASVAAAAVWVLWVTAAGLFRYPTWRFFHPLDYLLGLFNPWPWGAWLVIGPIGAITWNLRRGARGEGNDPHSDASSDLLDKVGLAGRVKTAELEAGGNRVRARVEVERGTHTAADVQDAKGKIAAVAGVRESAVRVVRHPDDAGQADLVITPRDLLRADQEWPGPSAPGASIEEALHAGLYEDAEVAQLWLPGDARIRRNVTHLAVSGMSGAGKSESGLCVVTDAITRPDVSFLFSDPVKGIQTVGPIAAGLGLLLTDRKPAVAAFRRLPNVIAARTHHLGRHGFKQWEPAAALPPCNLKFLVAWWEEAADLLADSELFVKVSEQARSAGISLVISQQRLSHDRINTSARANMGGGWCFGVNAEAEAKFALSDETIDAGAAPWEWKADKAGYSYLEAPGIDRDRWSITLRGYIADPGHLREVTAEHVIDPGFDEVTAAAFGQVYTDYRRRVAEGATDWQAALPNRTVIPLGPAGAGRLVPAAAGRGDQDVDDEDLDDVDGELDPTDDPDLQVPEQPEPGFMDDVDIEQPIPGDDDRVIPLVVPPPPGRREVSTGEARQALRDLLDRMVEAGHETVEPKQLVEFRRQIGREASWLTKELRRLVDEGALTLEPERGVYGLVAPERTAA